GLPKLAFWYSAEYQNANFGTRPFDSQINKTFLRSAERKNVNVGEKKFGFDFNLKLEKSIKNLEGKFEQEYPPYSSKTVGGKQLFQWAREGRMDEIEIPKREVEIYDIEYLGNYEITKKDLLKNIVERINKVTGDFRQKEIIQEWEKIPEARTLGKCVENFVISKFKVKCSSGTYVRAIVNRLGNELGVGTTTFRIKRTRVGEFKMKN
ncbi:hypothetical protein KKG48_01530, partial [Patescibacteria group bacterium]|nr:hypothetical protein [Patescibacteria group bacterium]